VRVASLDGAEDWEDVHSVSHSAHHDDAYAIELDLA
jgi:hypothetical protein